MLHSLVPVDGHERWGRSAPVVYVTASRARRSGGPPRHACVRAASSAARPASSARSEGLTIVATACLAFIGGRAACGRRPRVRLSKRAFGFREAAQQWRASPVGRDVSGIFPGERGAGPSVASSSIVVLVGWDPSVRCRVARSSVSRAQETTMCPRPRPVGQGRARAADCGARAADRGAPPPFFFRAVGCGALSADLVERPETGPPRRTIMSYVSDTACGRLHRRPARLAAGCVPAGARPGARRRRRGAGDHQAHRPPVLRAAGQRLRPAGGARPRERVPLRRRHGAGLRSASSRAATTNKTARAVAIYEGETLNAPALLAMLRQIIANNRAGGSRELRAKGA